MVSDFIMKEQINESCIPVQSGSCGREQKWFLVPTLFYIWCTGAYTPGDIVY